jgi:hypothetical protein
MALHDPKRKYNFAEDGLPPDSSRHSYLKRLIVPGKAQAFAPEMKGDGTTVVFLPYPDFEIADYAAQSRVLPDRISDQFNDFSRWLFFAPDKGVVRFGKNPVSLLFDNPGDASTGYIADEEHPIHLIYRSMYASVSKDILVETPVGTSASDDWSLLLNGNKAENKFEVIKRPDFIYAAYAFICRSGDKADGNYIASGPPLGAGSDDLPVIMFMLKSTIKELTALLNKPIRNDDPNAGLLHTHVTGDRFVHFYDKQKGSCEAMRGAAAAQGPVQNLGGHRRGPTGISSTEEKAGFGYGVHISTTFNGQPNGQKYTRDQVAQFACQRLRPWSETLLGHTPAQCADIVERVCGLPSSVLYHAWKSRPEFYSETLKGQFAARKTFLPQVPAVLTPRAAGGLMPTSGIAGTAPVTVTGSTTIIETADPYAAPWGGRSNDPPNPHGGSPMEATAPHSEAGVLPGVSSPDISKSVRDTFRSMLRTEVTGGGLPITVPPVPITPPPKFDPPG